jgi:hypothetical protein
MKSLYVTAKGLIDLLQDLSRPASPSIQPPISVCPPTIPTPNPKFRVELSDEQYASLVHNELTERYS